MRQHRLMEKRDFDVLYDIFMSPEVNPYMSYDFMMRADFEPILHQKMQDNNTSVFEDDNGVVVGMYRIERGAHRRSHVAYLGGFAVHPKYHGMGYGKQILNDIIAMLKAEGLLRIELIAESDNPNAINLYEKLGFTVEGILRKYLKRADEENCIDDYFMALLLI